MLRLVWGGQIRVLWQGRDPEWDEWDGGAFAKWMQACEDDEQQQRDIATSLGGQAVASLHRSSSQAFLGLRPQVHHCYSECSAIADRMYDQMLV